MLLGGLMKTISYFTFLYGILLFAGGLMAFQHAESILGLVIEAVAGAAFFVLGILMIKKVPYISYIAAALSLFLAIFFWITFAMTTSFYPGVLGGVSSFMFIYLIFNIFKLNGTE